MSRVDEQAAAPARPENAHAVHYVLADTPMDRFADDLEDLPVPPLDHTLKLYLKSLEPLLVDNTEAMEHSRRICASFAANEGPQLQAALEAHAETCGREKPYPHTHWLENFWDTYAYHSGRDPIAINVNCFGTQFQGEATANHLQRAAAAVHGLLRCKAAIDQRTLCPDVLDRRGNIPLCMFQYSRLFACTRVPGESCDSFVQNATARHIAVFAGGAWYAVDVIRPDGTPYSTVECAQQMTAVAEAAARAGRRELPVTAFTSSGRSEWARAREQLRSASPENATTMDAIEGALFHVHLSEARPATRDQIMNYCCHGDPSSGANIWMDKSFTLVIFANGKCGFNMEHSHADAPMHARILEFMKAVITGDGARELQAWRGVSQSKQGDAAPRPGLPAPVRLDWDVQALSDDLQASIAGATAFAVKNISDHNLALMTFEGYGKRRLKTARLGPDSFLQMALQIAFWRDQGRVCSTYETGTTRKFHHGRTETIRSLTSEARALCEGMDTDAGTSDPERLALLRAAVSSHVNLLRLSVLGMGIDRHLMGLRIMAQAIGLKEEPEIFRDPSFATSSSFELSTSNMSFSGYDFPGFGAPFPYSYGCCYCIQDDAFLCTVTTRKSCVGKNPRRFVRILREVLADLGEVLAAGEGESGARSRL